MSNIIVVGSISTDFVVITDKRPAVGETVTGKDFSIVFGGKGANQAVAASRLEANVTMVGCVGGDMFGSGIIENLKKNGVSTEFVETVPHVPSGAAHITVCDGDNSITYVPGANNEVSIDQINKNRALFAESDIVIVQNEVREEVVAHLIETCHELKVKVLYNPAPARPMAANALELSDYIMPNETEFELLFPGLTVEQGVKKYPNKLIVTLGSEGVIFHNGTEVVNVPAFFVEQATDTTGAGDTFNGAFAVALTAGLTMEESLRFANLASSLSIQKFGAQGGMPTLEEMRGDANYDEAWDVK